MSVMQKTGAFTRASRSEKRRRKLLILCYHGLSITDEHEWLPKMFITPDGFRNRLQTLRKMGANVLPLGEAVAHLHTGTLPPNAVAITFDDGFHDFFEFAVPLLTEFQMPATVYLTTYYCDYRMPVINLVLNYILWKARRDSVELAEQGFAETQPVRNYTERQAVVKKLLDVFQRDQLTTADKNAVAERLAQRLGVDYDELRARRMLQIMSREEARLAFEAGIDLQLHTHRHRTPRDKSLFEREISENRERIQELTGREPVHFCYPSGDYSPEFFPWLSEMGIRTATTCERGLAGKDSQDLLLPRFLDDSSVDLIRFQSFVAGVLTN